MTHPAMFLAVSFLHDPLALFLAGLALLVLFFWYFATEFDRRKRNIGSALILGITGLCALAIHPPSETLKKGIDIGGGSSFTLKVQPNIDDSGQPIPVEPGAAAQAEETIRKRLDLLGTKEPFIARQGADRIIVQMPGITPEQSAEVRAQLEKAAVLELKQVNNEGGMPGPDGKSLAERVHAGDEIAPGFKAYGYKFQDRDGNDRTEMLLLNRRTALDGSDVRVAQPNAFDPTQIDITLSKQGEDRMIALTKDMTPDRDRIAIVLDGEVLSAPVVKSVPLGRQFVIEGMDSAQEALDLSRALLNPLKNPLVIEEARTVSPTLGKAVVRQGIWAGVVGLSITFAFMLLYYRLGGFVALIALTLNGVFLFGAMAMFGFTLTLPGIAGMILTIGMAVDANVLIYERLREEMAAGKSLGAAINASYDKALSAILDSNLTTLITALILFWRASGTVKGFAVTLTIGLLTSMFAAIMVTRVLFWWGLDLKALRKLTFLNLIRGANYDFVGKTPIALTLSLITVLVTFGAFAWRRDSALGIDFTGGTLISFQLGDKKVSDKEVQQSLSDVKLSKLPFTQEENAAVTGLLLTVRCATEDTTRIIEELRKDIPVLGEQGPVVDDAGKPTGKTGPLVKADAEQVSSSLGEEFFTSSLIALGLGMLGIFLYIASRYEMSFAIGGLIALAHDVLITIGAVVLFGGELSLIHVGAILTVAGYSVNDTIVVFDRIRENLRSQRGEVAEVINGAINATLSRTILTSLTTIITVLILSLFGSAALKDFSVMILIGLVVGTFSSMFVAPPVVMWWSRLRGSNLRREMLESTLEPEVRVAR